MSSSFQSSQPGVASNIGLGLAVIQWAIVVAIITGISGLPFQNPNIPVTVVNFANSMMALLIVSANVYGAYRYPVWARTQFIIVLWGYWMVRN